jgi:hypothetical protein
MRLITWEKREIFEAGRFSYITRFSSKSKILTYIFVSVPASILNIKISKFRDLDGNL